MNTAKLNKWGNSTGVILPKKLLEHVGMEVGDIVRINVNSASGTIELSRAPERPEAEVRPKPKLDRESKRSSR